MDKRSLKLLSCFIVNEAKVPTKKKLQLLESIKVASEKELLNFLKVNEALLQEIRPKFKTAMSLSTGGSLGWAIYRKIRAKHDICTKKCGTYELNTVRRQVCMLRCNINETQMMINALKGRHGEESRMHKLQARVEKMKNDLREYEARAKARGTEY